MTRIEPATKRLRAKVHHHVPRKKMNICGVNSLLYIFHLQPKHHIDSCISRYVRFLKPIISLSVALVLYHTGLVGFIHYLLFILYLIIGGSITTKSTIYGSINIMFSALSPTTFHISGNIIKFTYGMFSLINHDSQWGRSEVVIICPDICYIRSPLLHTRWGPKR